MASLEDLRKKLEQLQVDLPAVLLQAATTVSMGGKALAERTIKDKGFGAMYSTEKVPAWFMEGKELNASGSNFIDEKIKKNEETNWKEFRGVQGLQINYVDLSYSNEMWCGMFPQEAYQSGTKFIAPLAHNNRAGQDKMNWNKKRYGDFIGKALKGNMDIMAKASIDEIMRFIEDSNL